MADAVVKQEPEPDGREARTAHKEVDVNSLVDFSDIILIVIGIEQTPFFIPQSIVRQNSKLIGLLLDGKKDRPVPDDKKIVLKASHYWLTSENFNVYINWMVYQTLGAFAVDPYRVSHDPVADQELWDNLCQLWLLSDFFLDEAFCEMILGHICRLNDQLPYLPWPETIEKVWQHTTTDSLLRQTILEAFLDLRASDLDCYNPEFVMALGKLALEERNKKRDSK